MALAGDVGCSTGPTLVGMVSGVMGDNLKMGILAGTVFPCLLLIGLLISRKGVRKKYLNRLRNGEFTRRS